MKRQNGDVERKMSGAAQIDLEMNLETKVGLSVVVAGLVETHQKRVQAVDLARREHRQGLDVGGHTGVNCENVSFAIHISAALMVAEWLKEQIL